MNPALCKHVPFKRVALVVMLATLAGCGIVPKKEAIGLYAPESRVQPDPAWPTVRWQLQIPRPHSSELLDSPRIVVRPANGELQVYHGAVWAEPAPDLLQAAVLRGFEDSGRITGVARRGSGVAGDYELVLDLRRFDSDYAGGSSPRADVEVVAKLIANKTNTVVATRTLRQQVPASGTEVGAVSKAFGEALGAIATEVVGWTLIEGERAEAAPSARR